jgi:hypothetical protein
MKSRQIKLFVVMSVLAGAASSAFAADEASPWSMSIIGGDSVGVTGSMRSPTTSTITDLGAVDPALAGSSGTLSLDKLRYEDLFKRKYDTGMEVDYSMNDNLQTYGRFNYEGLGGRTRTIGDLSTASLSSASPLTARFADADNTSLELGSRYFLTTGTQWRPFAGAAIGATHLDAMRASLASPDAGLDLKNVRFTRSGTVFSQSLETGVEYDPSTALGMRFGVQADHSGAPPSADDPTLQSLGFNDGNDAKSRWSFPVSLAATYHFG